MNENYKQRFQKESLKNQFINAKISNRNDLQKAIAHAYKKTASRTFSGIAKKQSKDGEITFNKFLNQLENYFKSSDCCNQEKFNAEWEKFYEAVKIDFKNFYEPSCGQCQKIINVTFKILSCFSDYEQYKEKFEYCHMILDSYTLNWYRTLNLNNDGLKKNMAWSNLEQKVYEAIQQNIFDKLKEGYKYQDKISLSKIPLEAEFIIWEGEKRAVAVKALNDSLNKCVKNSYLSEEEKCRIISKLK